MALVEIFLSPFIQVLFEKLASGYLSSFARREGIHSQVERWSGTLAQIQAVVDDAEEKQIEDRAVRSWMEHLRDLAYDLDDILDDFAYEALRRKLNTPARHHHHQTSTSRSSKVMAFMPTCCTNFIPSTLLSDRRMRSKINDITSRLQAISEQTKQLGLEKVSSASASTKPWQSPPITSPLMSEPRLYGRDNDKREIIDFLLKEEEISTHNSNFGVIPIVGMGGLGKTTLAQMVYNDEMVTQHFDLRVWVCVSDDFDILRITKAMLESVTSQACELKELDKVQAQLKQNLTGKKFLIVLDDVWDNKYHDWNVLKSHFNDGAPGSKVIITTRNREIGSMMGTVACHDLQHLSHDDCWSMFAHHAFGNKSINENQNFVSIGRKIVDKCGGLPLAAKTLGGLLRCKEREGDWEHVLNSKIWNLDGEINPALRLSYYHLPSHLKQCFAYCSLLPKDYEFEEQELVLLWMAEGFIRQTKGERQMEDVGGEYFRELLSRSFFQPSSNSSRFVMHDLINDFAQEVARHTCFRLEDYLKDYKQHKNLKKARHSSYMQGNRDGMKKFEAFKEIEHLRTFLPFSLQKYRRCYLTSEVPLDLLPRLRCLRVLNLRRYYVCEIENSIGDLKHLRYLDLSYSNIKMLPESVGALYNLQTLMLEGCQDLEKLPTDIGDLINLRHLNIGDSNSLEEMPMGIGKLTNLQTLSKFIISKGNGSRIRELGNLIHLKGELCIKGLQHVVDPWDARWACLNDKKGLEVLQMEWSDNSDAEEVVVRDVTRNDMVETEVLRLLQPHRNLKKLIIRRFYGSKFPDWIGDSLFTKMEDISLEDCKNCTSLPPLGKLPSLKMLNIQGMNAVKHVGREFYGEDCNEPFPLLETLSFVNMQEWEEWFNYAMDKEVQIFTIVSELSIEECPKLLGTLPSYLPSLRIIEITNCPHLSVGGSNFVLPSLASLHMAGLQLPSIPVPLIDVANMPKSSSLTSVKIEDIQIPESLCNPSMADEVTLGNAMLKHLNLVNYLSLENIQKLAFLPIWLTHGLMGLRELKIVECKELTTLWKNEVRLHALRKLEIRRCPQFVSLFEEKEAQGLVCCMPGLEYLDISSCGKLEKLPHGLLNTSLRKLGINDCMSLEFVFGWVRENDNDNINLQELLVENCPSLRYLINRGGLPPMLKCLEIRNCDKLEALLAEEGMKINCPSLAIVEISFCENLKYLPDVLHNDNNLRNLGRFVIIECENLESVPEGWIHPTSTNMRYLTIEECEKLEVLPAQFLQKNILTSLEGLGSVSCSGFLDKANFLINLIRLSVDNSKIGKPPSEWGLHRFSSLTHLTIDGLEESNSFPLDGMSLPPNLIELSIWNFPNLEKLSSEGFQNLASLESLYLQICPRLAILPKQGLPPSLLYLHVLGCPILGQRCERRKGLYWPLIAHIPQVIIQ